MAMSKKAFIAVTAALLLLSASVSLGLKAANANPLPPEWMNPKMDITIQSPQNETTNALPLHVEFMAQSSCHFFLPANESEEWLDGFFYVLDGQNMASGVRFTEVQGPKAVRYSIATDHNFSGQAYLTNLTEGSHKITVYWGVLINNKSVVYNANWSATTQFAITTEKPTPTQTLAPSPSENSPTFVASPHVPEFPLWALLPLIGVFTLMVYKTRGRKR